MASHHFSSLLFLSGVRMIGIEMDIQLDYQVGAEAADFIFNVHPAHTRCQTIQAERLELDPPLQTRIDTDPATGNRYLRLSADPGPLTLRYTARLHIEHYQASPDQLTEIPVRQLPMEVVPYLYPSRYCQSDRLARLATQEFGQLPPGYPRVQAIVEWVRARVSFDWNVSDSSTSAIDTMVAGAGICRDFSHLMIALCRAVGVPARVATGTDYGAELAPAVPDFHAYVEVYLGGRWYIFDPSGNCIPMGFVRIGTGRDAADVAFATIFGEALGQTPRVRVRALEDPDHGLVLPYLCRQMLSTDSGSAPD